MPETVDDFELYDRADVLERLDNDEDLCNEILGAYIKEAPVQFQRLNEALTAQQPEGFRRAAHAIKGAAGNVGAQKIFFLARTLEQIAGTGDWGKARQLVVELTALFKRLTVVARETYGVGE